MKNRMKNRKVKIINLGCKLNQFEGLGILQKLISYGYEELKNGENNPDITIINTCTVTRKSDRKSRHAIYSSVKHKKPGGIIIVTGCLAQTDRDDVRKISGIDLVVSNDFKVCLPDILKAGYKSTITEEGAEVIGGESGILNHDDRPDPFDFELPFTSERSRAFLKVQDGCDLRCAYCKVPIARGRSVSRAPEDVLEALKKLLNGGYREVVLTGVNLGAYKFDGVGLADLLEKCIKIPGRWRLRLSSIEPVYITEELINILSEDKIVPHFHIPLQSGSDLILKKMNRGYSSEVFRKIIQNIIEKKPDVHLATDVIVGFPTETENDFMKTVEMVDEVRFASLHVFKYSPRNGTSAALIKETVSEFEKKQRSDYLIRRSVDLNYSFRKKFLGKIREAIVEKHKNNTIALTDNYIKVVVNEGQKISEKMYGQLVNICIDSVDESNTYGMLVED